MFSTDKLHKLANRLSNLIPLKALFKDWLSQLDLVTREEFDIQSKVLIKTRSKLEALEKQVQKLTDKL